MLFAYVLTAFLVHPDWVTVLKAAFIPQIQWTPSFFAVLTGILGTTISPYLFFWQSSQEVEEEAGIGRTTVAQREGATDIELATARRDVIAGMFFSNAVMFFIILTTASTLHVRGLTTIATAREAAEALRPLAGDGAYLLFTLGIVGTGLLAIPVLAGSCAYAVSEAANWHSSSLDRPLKLAPGFYSVLAASVALGMASIFIGIDAVKMLFWSAVLNGVLAPPLIVLVLLLTGSRAVMGQRRNSWLLSTLGWLCALLMALCAAGTFAG